MIIGNYRSSSQKKGLSVSLSKKDNWSLPKQNRNKIVEHKDELWYINRPIQTITNNINSRPPVIVYRQTKNEWEKLQ